MSDRANSLVPSGFESLGPFVGQWARPTTAERIAARLASSASERDGFYVVASEKLGDALALLDRKPLNRLDEREQCLMNLMLSLAHVALAVEVQRDHESSQAVARAEMRMVRSTADAASGQHHDVA